MNAEGVDRYDVDEVTTTADLAPALAAFRRAHPDEPVYTLPATAKLGTDTVALKPALNAARCYKSAYEVDLIRHANAITAAAHAAVLAQLPHARSEAHLEAAFTAACIARHARAQPYAPIVGAGRNAAVLHYTRNAAPLAGAPLVLVDAAAEWHGYCADVTRTLPLTTDGRFPPRAQHIYDLVLAMQAACIARAVASADLRRLHALAHVIAVRGLLSLGILRLPTGTHEEDILAAGTSRAFFPHGLGHLLGLDVHDVDPPATQAAQAACLGVYDVIQHPLPGGARVMAPLVLEPGMVVTIEPGMSVALPPPPPPTVAVQLPILTTTGQILPEIHHHPVPEPPRPRQVHRPDRAGPVLGCRRRAHRRRHLDPAPDRRRPGQ